MFWWNIFLGRTCSRCLLHNIGLLWSEGEKLTYCKRPRRVWRWSRLLVYSVNISHHLINVASCFRVYSNQRKTPYLLSTLNQIKSKRSVYYWKSSFQNYLVLNHIKWFFVIILQLQFILVQILLLILICLSLLINSNELFLYMKMLTTVLYCS